MGNILSLTDSVNKIRGIGPRYLSYLEKLNIKTVEDLLRYFPFRYDDYSQLKKIKDLKENEVSTVIAELIKIKNRRSFRRRMFITEAVFKDETGELLVIWFNQPFLTKTLAVGSRVSLSGKPVYYQSKKLTLVSPAYEIIKTKGEKFETKFFRHTGRLVPVYSETAGLTSRALRYFIRSALASLKEIPEILPSNLLKKLSLLELKKAFWKIHYPNNLKEAEAARKRFIFEELLLIQLSLLRKKKENDSQKAPLIKVDIPLIQEFVNHLDFKLTDDQRRAIWQIIKDFESAKPMNRLLEGDVGSGKTVVALAAALLVIKSGYQVVFLVPTEILAHQHFLTSQKFFKDFNIKIALLTAHQSKIFSEGLSGKIKKETLKKELLSGEPMLVIGTQALIQKEVRFSKLGLVIIDEQHRFGVRQRLALVSENKNQYLPHQLSLTATPIPRTLALALYGDLSLSVLRQRPAGRQKIITKVVPPQRQKEVFEFIRREIKKGRQAYVICPRIEPKELKMASNLLTYRQYLNYEVKAVKAEFKKLTEEIFPEFKIAMLHGRLKAEEKNKIMEDFKKGEIDILVSTSVIEVGIDVKNVTIVMIEGADHFGLAQLHQFRGRVGRSDLQSYCFLLTESGGALTLKRLRAMVNCDDGFRLAEMDLAIRGPGEFLGLRQSGLPDLAMEGLKDPAKISLAQKSAQELLEQSPDLSLYPALSKRLEKFNRDFSFN